MKQDTQGKIPLQAMKIPGFDKPSNSKTEGGFYTNFDDVPKSKSNSKKDGGFYTGFDNIPNANNQRTQPVFGKVGK